MSYSLFNKIYWLTLPRCLDLGWDSQFIWFTSSTVLIKTHFQTISRVLLLLHQLCFQAGCKIVNDRILKLHAFLCSHGERSFFCKFSLVGENASFPKTPIAFSLCLLGSDYDWTNHCGWEMGLCPISTARDDANIPQKLLNCMDRNPAKNELRETEERIGCQMT